MEIGVADLQDGKDVVRAVLLDVEIIKIVPAELPEMEEQVMELVLREIEFVLPEVAAFPVSVLLHFRVIRDDRKSPGEKAEEPLQGVQQGVVRIDRRGVIDAIIQKRLLRSGPRPIDPQKRMAEHRGRVV